MSAYENVLTAAILLGLFVLIYSRYTHKSFGDIIKDVKDAVQGGAEEVQEVIPIKWKEGKMNKFLKILVAILGGVNTVFNIFVPIAVALISISFFDLTSFSNVLIMLVGILSTIYRAVEVFIK